MCAPKKAKKAKKAPSACRIPEPDRSKQMTSNRTVLFVSSPILAVAEYNPSEPYIDGSLVPVCWTQIDQFWPALFFILCVSVFFFVPLLILVVLYTVIARTLMKNPNILAPPRRDLAPPSTLRYRKQVVAMLGTVVLAFFVCLLPFRALTLWIIVDPTGNILRLGLEFYYNVLYFCRIMFHLNSAINPILYNVMSSKFRAGFLRLCGCRSKRKKRRGHSGSGSGSGRKNASNTTSSTNASQNNDGSFWSRYGNSKRGRKDPENVVGAVGAVGVANAATATATAAAVDRQMYVKIPAHIRRESYV